jgi:hypothetical protein
VFEEALFFLNVSTFSFFSAFDNTESNNYNLLSRSKKSAPISNIVIFCVKIVKKYSKNND